MYYLPPELGNWTCLLFWSFGNQESCNQGIVSTVLCPEHPGDILFFFSWPCGACLQVIGLWVSPFQFCSYSTSPSSVFLCLACLLLLLCSPKVLLVIAFLMDPWLSLNSILISTHPNCSQPQSYSVMWALCFYVLNGGMDLLFWEQDRW